MIYRIAAVLFFAFSATSPQSAHAAERNGSAIEDLTLSIRELRTLAEQGDANAQATIGQMYYKGNDVPRDYSSALNWLKKAVASQHAGAAMTLALMYAQGQAVKKDLGKAFELAHTAAEKGNAVAQRVVGNMYDSGKGIARDLAKASGWYQKAAIQGDLDAQYNLGTMYYSGEGVKLDKVLAYTWFSLATNLDRIPTKAATKLRDKVRRSLSQFELSEAHQLLAAWRPGQLLVRKEAKSNVTSTDFITPKLALDYELHDR
jgi:TPR repeat protein